MPEAKSGLSPISTSFIIKIQESFIAFNSGRKIKTISESVRWRRMIWNSNFHVVNKVLLDRSHVQCIYILASVTTTTELTSCHRDRVGRTAWNIYSLLSEPFPAWLSGTLSLLWLTRKHMSKAILCHSWIQYACHPSNGRQQPHSAAFTSIALSVILKAHHGLEYHNQGFKTHNCNLSKLNNKR